MLHKVISAVIAIAFLILVRSTEFAFRVFFPAMLVYAGAVLTYNFWHLKKQHVFNFWIWLRYLIFIAAIVSIYLGLPGRLAFFDINFSAGFIKGFYLIFAIVLIYITELGVHVISEQGNFLLTLLPYFGLTLGIFAMDFFYSPPGFIILLLLGIMTFLIVRSSFEFIPQERKQKNMFAIIIALAAAEIGWPLLFLPLHYTVSALIAFNVFYVLWIIIYYHLYHNLNQKKVYFHIIFSTLLVFVAIMSTPWK